MALHLRLLVAATAVRAALVCSGLANQLTWRIETSTPANSLLSLRECAALAYTWNTSPYHAASCRMPPILVWLMSPWVQHSVLFVLPNIAMDLLAAILLRRLAICVLWRKGQHQSCLGMMHTGKGLVWGGFMSPDVVMALFAFNPFAIASCISGSSSSLENACVIAAVYCGVVGNVTLAAFAIAAGAYVGMHPLLLLVPAALMIAHGVEDVAGAHHRHCLPAPHQAPDGADAATVSTDDSSTSGGSTSAKKGGGSGCGEEEQQQQQQQHGQRTATGSSAAQAAPGTEQQQQQQGMHEPEIKQDQRLECPCAHHQQARSKRKLTPSLSVALLLGTTALWLLALLAASDVVLRQHPSSMCLPSWLEVLRSWLARAPGSGMSCHRTGGGGGSTGAAADPARSLHSRTGSSTSSTSTSFHAGAGDGCWAAHVYSLPLLVADQTPTLGQFWYFFVETFASYRAFFRFVAHSHAVLFAVPLALRFPRRPLLLACCQSMITCLFKPYPSVGDYAQWMALLPLMQGQLRRMRTGLLLVNSLLLLAALEPAMWHQWISIESANSNFLYSVTLLLGAWQVLLLVQLLLLTVQEEEEEEVRRTEAADAAASCPWPVMQDARLLETCRHAQPGPALHHPAPSTL